MLDISRDKVPTTASLERLIDLLASLKVNQVQLYSEHTFAYRNHPTVHAGASPLDAEEIRRLDAFCRARHVELVPNQNCLGHMNRWLAHEPYRHLAIAPDGFVDPYGITPAAHDDRADQPGLAGAGARAAGRAPPALHEPPGPRRARRGLGAAGRAHGRLLGLGGHPARAARARGPRDAHVGRHAGGPGRPAGPPARRRHRVRVGLRRLAPLRRALRRPGRVGRAVLGGARARRPGSPFWAGSPTRGRRAGRRPRRRWPTERPATSTRTGATRATCSSPSSASRGWPTAPPCPGASRPTPTSTSAPP